MSDQIKAVDATLRDHFALCALQGLLAFDGGPLHDGDEDEEDFQPDYDGPEKTADDAYYYADAMLAARLKESDYELRKRLDEPCGYVPCCGGEPCFAPDGDDAKKDVGSPLYDTGDLKFIPEKNTADREPEAFFHIKNGKMVGAWDQDGKQIRATAFIQ